MQDRKIMTSAARSVLVTLLPAALVLSSTPTAAETAYVSNEKDNTITVIDGATLQATATVPVGQRPRGIVLSKDMKSLFICASDDDRIEVLDLATLKVTRHLPSGPDP